MEETYIPAYTLANRFEADLVADTLEKEGIPFWIRSFEDTAYDGLFVVQKGWGQVLVPRSAFHKTVRLIHFILKNPPQKGLYEDPEQIDPKLWEELTELDPEEVCQRVKVGFNSANKSYTVPFFNGKILCFPEKRLVEFEQPMPYNKVDFELVLVTLHYLIHGNPVEPTGRWLGEKDLPGGYIFFHGPHQLPTRPLEELFQMDSSYLEKAASILGGKKEEKGDLAYVFKVFPRVPMLIVFWKGDEEFEPKVSFRFDETITKHFPLLDQVFALSYTFYRQIMAASKM